MDYHFLLKLVFELLEGDNPTAEEIGCAKKILKEMIDSGDKEIPSFVTGIPGSTDLDLEAERARRELTNEKG